LRDSHLHRVLSLNSERRAFTGGSDRIQTPCIISRNENSVTMPPLSTSMIHCFRTSSCLVVNASSNTQHQYPHPYTPLPPLSSSIPICTGDSGNSCFALLLLFTSSFSRVALPPTSFFLSLQRSSASLLLYAILKLCDLLSRLLAVGRLHVQLVLFASSVVGVGDLAFGLAAGVS
jgi:hypothetical protein